VKLYADQATVSRIERALGRNIATRLSGKKGKLEIVLPMDKSLKKGEYIHALIAMGVEVVDG
jgi:hypothetical protein